MPFPSGANITVARVYYGTPERDPQQLLLYYAADGAAPTPTIDARDLADAIDAQIAGPMKAVLTTSTGYHGVSVALHLSGVVYNANSTINAGNGAVVSDECPDFVAAVIQKRTAHGGRTGYGRWFIGGVPETNTDESHLNAGAITDYTALGDAFNSSQTVNGVNYDPVHLSLKDSAFYAIVVTHAQRTLATQRRRLVRSFL